jgi:hypothetical protein
MTFDDDEQKDDATFEAELAALIDKARDGFMPQSFLEQVVAAFYRRHGRAIPNPIVQRVD